MNYIELRKNLNLTLKQFKTKIAILNIDFKDDCGTVKISYNS